MGQASCKLVLHIFTYRFVFTYNKAYMPIFLNVDMNINVHDVLSIN